MFKQSHYFISAVIFLFTFNNTDAQTNYIVGNSYYFTNNGDNLIEYIAGDLPIIIGQPHDGQLTSSQTGLPIIDSSRGNDNFTSESTALLKDFIYQKTNGGYPHIIINHLNANVLNLAREKSVATGGNTTLEDAWEEFHNFIDDAKDKVIADWGTGHYFEMHGNGVSDEWTMVGLGVDNDILDLSDSEIASEMKTNAESTIKLLANTLTDTQIIDAVKGPNSIGGYLNQRNWKSAPSVQYPEPNNRIGSLFFRGGWNTYEHSLYRSVKVDATHLENYWSHMDNDPNNRDPYIDILADAIINYMEEFYEDDSNNSFDLDCGSYGSLIKEGFGTDYGDLNDGGANATRISNSTYANTGSWSVRLNDGNGSDSRIWSDSRDLREYDEVYVYFSYYPRNTENGDNFYLEVRNDSGQSYTQVENWISGTDFNDNTHYDVKVKVTGSFGQYTRFALVSDFTTSNDEVYIDDFLISTCDNTSYSSSSKNAAGKESSQIVSEEEIQDFDEIKIYPNPTSSNRIFINLSSLNNKEVDIELYNINGQKLKYLELNGDYSNVQEINFGNNIAKGVYIIKISGKEMKTSINKRIIIK